LRKDQVVIIEKHVEKAMRIATGMFEKACEAKEKGEEKITEYNNLIVFTGDRGSGKSTAMRTFTERVKTESKVKVHVLPPIDPTLFARDERLVGAVVSHIYSIVKKYRQLKNTTFRPIKDAESI